MRLLLYSEMEKYLTQPRSNSGIHKLFTIFWKTYIKSKYPKSWITFSTICRIFRDPGSPRLPLFPCLYVLCKIYLYRTDNFLLIVWIKYVGCCCHCLLFFFRVGWGEVLSLVTRAGLTNIFVVHVAHFKNTGNFLAS